MKTQAGPRVQVKRLADLTVKIFADGTEQGAMFGLVGKDSNEYSLDTVRMFHQDAAQAGYSL